MPIFRTLVQPKLLTLALLLVSSLGLAPARAEEAPAAAVESADSFVIGTGLVIGLAGTGDSRVDDAAVARSIVGLLERTGLEPWRGAIAPGRVAKVIVTAELPPDAAPGTPLVITVTAVGDATSLAGGTLLATPLRYSSGRVHSVGQGRIALKNQVATVGDPQVVSGYVQVLAAN